MYIVQCYMCKLKVVRRGKKERKKEYRKKHVKLRENAPFGEETSAILVLKATVLTKCLPKPSIFFSRC